MVRRRALLAVTFALGCSWELPLPMTAVRDVPRDEGAPTPDVVGLDAADVQAAEVSVDAPVVPDVMDVVDARVAVDAAPDVPDAPAIVDVRDGAAPRDGECAPGDFRACFNGDRSTLGLGYCRAGALVCDRGMFGTRCEGEVTRDCDRRVCGSDGCEGSCGRCPDGQVCDDTGSCATTACGPMNFTVACGAGNCPANSMCVGGRCQCNASFQARLCQGDACPPSGCTGTDWWCAPAPFCGDGAINCGTFQCPRWSVCDVMARTCTCRPGFVGRRCDGTPCTACPGTGYECVPGP